MEIGDDGVRTAPILAGGDDRSRIRELRSGLSVFCRHNRFKADCPICSKGTVLDSSRHAPRAPARAGCAEAGGRGEPPAYQGPHASAGPYEDDEGSYEVRLEKVPGGVRLAAWMAGSIRRAAPVLRAATCPPGCCAERGRGGRDRGLEAPPPSGPPSGEGASAGRAGELQEELRVEPLEDGRVRVARWILRPNRGWELQEAPPMLPAARYAEAFLRASG